MGELFLGELSPFEMRDYHGLGLGYSTYAHGLGYYSKRSADAEPGFDWLRPYWNSANYERETKCGYGYRYSYDGGYGCRRVSTYVGPRAG